MANLIEEFFANVHDTITSEGNIRKNKLGNDLKVQHKQKTEARSMKENMFAKQKVKYTKKIDRLLENLQNLISVDCHQGEQN